MLINIARRHGRTIKRIERALARSTKLRHWWLSPKCHLRRARWVIRRAEAKDLAFWAIAIHAQTYDLETETLERHADLMDDLARSLKCPSCGKIVKPPFFNLGEKFHWAEGCKECYEDSEMGGRKS